MFIILRGFVLCKERSHTFYYIENGYGFGTKNIMHCDFPIFIRISNTPGNTVVNKTYYQKKIAEKWKLSLLKGPKQSIKWIT